MSSPALAGCNRTEPAGQPFQMAPSPVTGGPPGILALWHGELHPEKTVVDAMAEPPTMTAGQRCRALSAALQEYRDAIVAEYDEPLCEVIAHAAAAGSLGKSDLGALLLWKRIRIGAWATDLLCMADKNVREITGEAVTAARDRTVSVVDAARNARSALVPLPGARTGDAFASAVLLAAEPERMAVYDYRAHLGLWRLGLRLDEQPGLYGRYMALIGQCRAELGERGYGAWTAREVDLALFTHGKERRPRTRPWRSR